MTLRLGLAGLGVHGSRYAGHLLAGDVPGAKLTAVCRRDETAGRQFAAHHGVAYVGEAEALARHPDVDAVVLVLPPDHHASAAEACLGQGRPVLVEKPLATTTEAASRVAARADETGTPLMVAHTLRFDGVVRALRRERDSIGPLSLITINQRFEPTDRAWIDTPGRGGMFLNTSVHGFDLLRFLTGLEPVSVTACSSRIRTQHTEDQLVAMVTLGEGDVLAVLDNARSSHSRSGRIELVGRDGQLWGDHAHRTLERVQGYQRTNLGPIDRNPTVPETLNAFVSCVIRQQPPPITARDGLAAVRMVEAAITSDKENRPVAL